MIRVLGRTSGNLIKVEATGDLTGGDLETLGTKLRKLVDEHGKLRILLAIDGTGWQRASAEVADGQLDLDTAPEVERLAILTDERSAPAADRFFGEIGEGATRLFAPDQEQAAWDWLASAEAA
jgi:hypothetical protein